jgi:hypothetical protein
MKARYGFTSQGKKAMISEIKRQIKEQEDEYIRGIDAVFLWWAYTELGYRKKRLIRSYKSFIRTYKEMCEYYQMDDTYPAEYKLREIGVDLDSLRKDVTK